MLADACPLMSSRASRIEKEAARDAQVVPRFLASTLQSNRPAAKQASRTISRSWTRESPDVARSTRVVPPHHAPKPHDFSYQTARRSRSAAGLVRVRTPRHRPASSHHSTPRSLTTSATRSRVHPLRSWTRESPDVALSAHVVPPHHTPKSHDFSYQIACRSRSVAGLVRVRTSRYRPTSSHHSTPRSLTTSATRSRVAAAP